MQTIEIKEYNNASLLPTEWDEVAKDNVYLSREFLAFIEKTENDYEPTYYLFYENGRADSCFTAHRRKKYNLGMFTKFNLKINATFIYLPMCVTEGGFVIGNLKKAVFEKIKSIKGYKMVFNLPFNDVEDFAVGLTCPRCILDLNFDGFQGYLNALRSDYRNKYKKVMKASKDLTLRFIDNQTEFTDELYQMYLAVLNKSRLRIETLSKEYFMGKQFKIFVMELNGKPVGFTQLLENKSQLIFEFVGVDYSYNDEYSVYHRMLYEIIRYGTENGFKTIDFGQTADDTKLKLGSRYEILYAALHHTNPLVLGVCKKLAKFIEYKPLTTKFHVFKENENEISSSTSKSE